MARFAPARPDQHAAVTHATGAPTDRRDASSGESGHRVLVVEDDDTIGSVLTTTLSRHGYRVLWCPTGRAALSAATASEVGLILLDLGLPDIDGIDVCRELRASQPGCVIVMLTARTEEMDVIVGLEAGADDYLTKPVRLGELLARVRAHLRRAGPAEPGHYPVHIAGDLVVDTGGRRVHVSGHELVLRGKEFDLLARLMASANVALTRETLMSDVWDEHWFGSTKTLDVHVAALRRKLDTMSEHGRIPRIVTLRRHGYRLEDPDR